MLEGKKVSKNFGGLKALRNVDFRLEKGEILGLVGPNGSGKTTLFNVITGVYKPDGGVITYKGKEISGRPSPQIAKMGIGRTFQIVKPFLNMTFRQNVAVPCVCRMAAIGDLSEACQEADQWLAFCRLEKKKDVMVRDATYAECKRLEMARVLALKPEVVLFDELLAGLNPTEVDEALVLLRRIREELGITIFMIEHVMRAVMNVAERIMVLNYGEKIAEGQPKEIVSDPIVIESYLGAKYA